VRPVAKRLDRGLPAPAQRDHSPVRIDGPLVRMLQREVATDDQRALIAKWYISRNTEVCKGQIRIMREKKGICRYDIIYLHKYLGLFLPKWLSQEGILAISLLHRRVDFLQE
jgi:hypothetical protein